MAFLDDFDQYTEDKCERLNKQSSTFEKITQKLGMSSLVNGVQNFLEQGIVNSLLKSPLRKLGEDILAQAIQKTARRLSQNLLNQVSGSFTKTLKDVRATVFNTVLVTMTFKNDMVLYFASVTAQECVDAIREKRKNLIALQESIRKLHNALLVLASGGPFFNKYLADLRQALILIDQAEKEVFKVQSAFYSTSNFPIGPYNRSKQFLDQAYSLIIPPVSNKEMKELDQGFLKNVLPKSSEYEYKEQLAMLTVIPKLTEDMLKQYDKYALRVLKVNALLLGFQSVVQNLQFITGGKFKDLVLDQLRSTRTFLKDLTNDMSLQLNGEEGAISSNRFTPSPNPTKTSAKAISWAVRVKSAQTMLEILDPKALQKISISNAGLSAYNKALNTIAKLNDRVSSVAILKATAGRETPGTLEADFITFAFQANQAIVDSSLLETQQGRFSPNTVLALGAKLNSRIQLSIDQDREIEQALLQYIKTVAPLLDGIKDLGKSIFSLMEGLGMDKALDSLKRSDFGKFFSMDAKTASYVGSTIAGLSALQALLTTNSQKECLEQAITKVRVEETSRKLVAQRTVQQQFTKLQRVNEIKCKELKTQKKRVEGCTSGINIADLRDNPLKSLSGSFAAVFGGDVADSLGGTLGGFANLSFSKGNSGIANLDGLGANGGSTVFTNVKASALAAKDAVDQASKKVGEAKEKMAEAINKVEGYKASATESLGDLTKKLSSAENAAPESIQDILKEAKTSKQLSDVASKEAKDMLSNMDKVKDVFGSSPGSSSLLSKG